MEDALGVDGRRPASAACGGCSTAASGSRATRCTSSCCTRRTSSAIETRIAMAERSPARSSTRALQHEEGRQRHRRARSAAGRSTRSTSASAASTARRRSASSGAAAEQLECGARAARARRCAGLAKLPFPDFEQDYEFVALRHPDDYPIERRPPGLEQRARHRPGEYEEHFIEEHVEHSTALHSRLRDGGTYFLGPMARYSLNSAQLSPLAREAAAEAGLGPACRNPFQSIVVRGGRDPLRARRGAAADRAYEPARRRPPSRSSRAPASGCGWSEAPRGLLWHRYELDGGRLDRRGTDRARRPPRTRLGSSRTCASSSARASSLADERLQWECEQAIRNYDPCISCSTHFLRLDVDRG